LANRLAADRNTRVLLLEAGGNDNYHWIHIPVGYLYCINNPRTDWCFSTEKEEGLNGRALNYPRGKVLGGCSSINGTKSVPSLSADLFGDWREEIVFLCGGSLRVYTTTAVTKRRIPTLMHDPQYRMNVTSQNSSYNQPPHTSFHIGAGMKAPPRANILVR
jgi:choline dehydrogenase-like flavoprotein